MTNMTNNTTENELYVLPVSLGIPIITVTMSPIIVNILYIVICVRGLKEKLHNILVLSLCISDTLVSLSFGIFILLPMTNPSVGRNIPICLSIFSNLIFGIFSTYCLILLISVERFLVVRSRNFGIGEKLNRMKYSLIFGCFAVSLSVVLVIMFSTPRVSSIQNCSGPDLYGNNFVSVALKLGFSFASLIFLLVIFISLTSFHIWKIFFKTNSVSVIHQVDKSSSSTKKSNAGKRKDIEHGDEQIKRHVSTTSNEEKIQFQNTQPTLKDQDMPVELEDIMDQIHLSFADDDNQVQENTTLDIFSQETIIHNDEMINEECFEITGEKCEMTNIYQAREKMQGHELIHKKRKDRNFSRKNQFQRHGFADESMNQNHIIFVESSEGRLTTKDITQCLDSTEATAGDYEITGESTTQCQKIPEGITGKDHRISPETVIQGHGIIEDHLKPIVKRVKQESWEMRAFKTNLIIAFTTILLTGPFVASFFYDVFADTLMPWTTRAFIFLLFTVNSGVNPFIYAWRLPEIREAFRSFYNKLR